MREGWMYKKLGEVCSSIKDGSHNPPKGCSFSEYIMISSQNIFNEELRLEDVRYLGYDDFIIEDKRTNLRAGDVLLTIVGTIGRCYVFKGNEGNITLQRSVAVLSPKDFIDSRFLMYSLRGKNQVLVDEAHGIAQKGIYLKQLSSLEISYPNVSTQQQIVSELDLLSHILDQKRQQLKEYDALAESIFYDMFGDPVENPKGFEIVTLNDVCQFIKDGTHQTPRYIEKEENGVKFLSAKDVVTGSINWDNIKYIPQDLHEELYARIAPQRNDVLLCKNGTYGIAALVETDEIFDIYVSLALLRPTNRISPKYLVSAINTETTMKQFKSSIKGIGVPNLHLGEIKKTKIILPPLTLQRSFAAKIESIEHQKQLLRASIKETEMLFQSRMDYWFNS